MGKTRIFEERMTRHEAELRGIYEELYHDGTRYGQLVEIMREFYGKRSADLKGLDR